MTKEYTDNLEEIATFGFEAIDPDEKVEVNLKDLMYVFSTLQEYQRFFHQPLHYKNIKDIERFLGSINEHAGFKLLHTSIHEKMRNMLPAHIDAKYGEGDFDSPKLPFYYDGNR
ncbi:hypothetical protein [Rheinheimera aquimaris]|uniref:hypothetical protein n=1 Tax=Rheinheimera aquimaris TaxID=412437 RepID=UPI000E95CA95|nr:hypothetical protein [Rheinheimera aquimaris]MCD1599364.1 hypothetical protein [Rheinheimera aquimaris]HBN90881.1 hypothetical protein [Rheinheimera sp.]